MTKPKTTPNTKPNTMPNTMPNTWHTQPDADGRFGIYGGRFVAETLMPLIREVEEAWQHSKTDPEFQRELAYYRQHYIGRPSPLYFAKRLTEHFGGGRLYLKRDELNHTGAHKINNVLGQALLAKRLGKSKIIAETGAGQHGVATATIAALFGMECEVFMGVCDIERQKPNVDRMHLLGAKVHAVENGGGTLKDAMNEALRYWVACAETHFYIIGTVAGPHPYPAMVRDFQAIIGEEARQQILEAENRLPNALVACIGGGSNALGLFYPFLNDSEVRMYGVEAAGKGIATGEHAASISGGVAGVLHGNRTYLLQDKHGQIKDAYSISAGLDYPGIGPEHAWLNDKGRVEYVHASDDEAIAAFGLAARLEGIIPALEPAHALAFTAGMIGDMSADAIVIMNMCGRGDKDLASVMPDFAEKEGGASKP